MKSLFREFNEEMPASLRTRSEPGALLSALADFFEQGRWGSPVQTGAESQSLTEEDQLFLLLQAALYLTATRGHSAPEARACYERAEPLCHSLNRPQLLYLALLGQWHCSLLTDKLSATMQVAERLYSLAQEHHEPAQMIEYTALWQGPITFWATSHPPENTP